jgi:hypothetical protein
MRFAQTPAATVANMENDNRISLDGEQHPV